MKVSLITLLMIALCGCMPSTDEVIGPKVPGWPNIRYVGVDQCATMTSGGNVLSGMPQEWHTQSCSSLGVPDRQMPK